MFAGGVDSVRNNETEGVIEYEHCDLERDALMFRLILEVLGRIPLVLHGVYT